MLRKKSGERERERESERERERERDINSFPACSLSSKSAASSLTDLVFLQHRWNSLPFFLLLFLLFLLPSLFHVSWPLPPWRLLHLKHIALAFPILIQGVFCALYWILQINYCFGSYFKLVHCLFYQPAGSPRAIFKPTELLSFQRYQICLLNFGEMCTKWCTKHLEYFYLTEQWSHKKHGFFGLSVNIK